MIMFASHLLLCIAVYAVLEAIFEARFKPDCASFPCIVTLKVSRCPWLEISDAHLRVYVPGTSRVTPSDVL